MKHREDHVIIYSDPFTSPLEVVGDVAFALGPGCTDQTATLLVGASVEEYFEERPDPDARVLVPGGRPVQEIGLRHEAGTMLQFKAADQTEEIVVEGVPFWVTFKGVGFRKLDAKGAKNPQGQWFRLYTFAIEWETPD